MIPSVSRLETPGRHCNLSIHWVSRPNREYESSREDCIPTEMNDSEGCKVRRLVGHCTIMRHFVGHPGLTERARAHEGLLPVGNERLREPQGLRRLVGATMCRLMRYPGRNKGARAYGSSGSHRGGPHPGGLWHPKFQHWGTGQACGLLPHHMESLVAQELELETIDGEG